MEAFVSRKRQKLSPSDEPPPSEVRKPSSGEIEEPESTDFKLALLASLHPDHSQEVLLDYLLAYDGSVERATAAITGFSPEDELARKKGLGPSRPSGYQSSLTSFASSNKVDEDGRPLASAHSKLLTKKGRTLHLYSPADIEKHTPCSMIQNFLPPDECEALTKELMNESREFIKHQFQMFDRVVETGHGFRFYVNSLEEAAQQKADGYVYNGGYVEEMAQSPPHMLHVSNIVKDAVNAEIERRKREFNSPPGSKLKFQTDEPWKPNASFLNCYDGGKQSLGWHSDHLTYLGPRPVIGSLSLGVTREFRVRRIVPQVDALAGDQQGQIAIHVPHNSLLVMHAAMQEEWKHSISAAATVEPHPLTGLKRLNLTYRCFRNAYRPCFIPRCKCDFPCVMRCVQKRAATRGRYMWQCIKGFSPGEAGCGFFEWAEIDIDGRPPWVEGYKGNANLPNVVSEEADGEVKREEKA